MAAISGDQLRGHLDGLILAALERGAAHGWDIWRSLEAASGGALRAKEGSLIRPCIAWRAGADCRAVGSRDGRPPRAAATRLSLDRQGPPSLGRCPRSVAPLRHRSGQSFGSPGMKALRIHVERVVRPIRASNRRKDRMREELLAHLVGLFDEERRERAMTRRPRPARSAALATRRRYRASCKTAFLGSNAWP